MQELWVKMREERGQPFLFMSLDLWSSAKARDSFGCICFSLIRETMKVDREEHLREIAAKMAELGKDDEDALAIARSW